MGKHVVIMGMALAMLLGMDSNNVWAKGDNGGGGHKKGKGSNAKAMFAKWDANSDGKVTKAEFLAATPSQAKKSGKAINKEKRFAKIDANGDGSITLPELKKFLNRAKKQNAA